MISLKRVALSQGMFSLEGVSLEVSAGQYGVLMGKTGTGKTTLLEAICGLRPILSGLIHLDGRNVTGLKPAARGVGYVPQDGSLFSRLSVQDHLAFALVIRRWSRAAIARRVRELASLLGIEHLLDRLPRGLSGGEVQRVALGRALAMRPAVLLLDEPLSALDEDTRAEMHDLLLSVRRQTESTVLHVTHNRSEAQRLADRLFELQDGRIVEIERKQEAPSGLPSPAFRARGAGGEGT
jgi:molybdate/tungstate transport system ATP-binding protein